jgi:hypothetical protein
MRHPVTVGLDRFQRTADHIAVLVAILSAILVTMAVSSGLAVSGKVRRNASR